MTIQVSAQDARNKFAEILNTTVYGKTNVVITRFNKPQAVLIDYKEYERLTNPHLRMTHKKWAKGFKVLDKIRKRIPKIDPAIIEKQVDIAVQQVREAKGSRRA